MLRPLVVDFRTDKKALDVSDQYLFGPAFLVSPVTIYQARSRSVYLPNGAALEAVAVRHVRLQEPRMGTHQSEYHPGADLPRVPDQSAVLDSRRRSGRGPPALLRIGSEVGGGRFVIGRFVGRGGMGAVYQAFDRERASTVAFKTLTNPDADGIYRLKREFRSLADVHHDNLVRLHELFSEGDLWFFTMDFMDARSLFRAGTWMEPVVRFVGLSRKLGEAAAVCSRLARGFDWASSWRAMRARHGSTPVARPWSTRASRTSSG
jgi:hypothetical protein